MKRIIILFSLLFALSCNNSQEKILPTNGSLTESVYSSVTIQPDSLYQVYAAVGGILDANLVDEGDLVFNGQPMMQIINSTPKLNMQNAKLAYELAKEKYNGKAAILEEIKDEIVSARLKFKNDSINFYRQKNLWNQNIGSKIEYENRKLTYELSTNNLNLLQSKYRRTEQELETQLKQAENNYKTAAITTRDFTVKSKINGKIYALYKNPGEVVNTMEPLAAVGCSDDFLIEMLVDEVDIVKLRVGQKTLVTLDAYNSKVFEATLTKIYPKKDERSQTFTVEAVFIEPPKVLYAGLAGEGNIIIAKKQDALSIPKEYLIDDSKVITENGEVNVEIGLQNLDRVEILSGIDENTYLLKPKE
ncbi:efflux RND transporter periplasmic adaptor subunit [Sungkyunkwania multivorans]|uniref:Efflux RND transporter periplasmic adaptor subunit n=1 Tax=Sungkyunkwania multivorans TaxID=1173618 RepID=A0ABW3D481_9FLAO